MKLYPVLCSALAGGLFGGSLYASLGGSAVEGAPVITQHPESLELLEGGAWLFSVEAEGVEPIHFQWHKDVFEYVDETNSTFFTGPTEPVDAGNYFCIVSNALGVVTSETAVLTIETNFFPEVTAAL